jgi:hypothetical protein
MIKNEAYINYINNYTEIKLKFTKAGLPPALSRANGPARADPKHRMRRL